MRRIPWTWAASALFLTIALGGSRLAAAGQDQGALAEGRRIYGTICIACHGPQGDGTGPRGLFLQPKPMNFTDGNYMRRLQDDYLFAVVKYGKTPVMTREHEHYQGAVSMPAFEERLEPEEIDALLAFERAFLSGAPQNPDARELFLPHCADCHGADGRGMGPTAAVIQPAPADFADSKFMARFSEEYLRTVIAKGKVGAVREGFETMPAYGHILSDREIRGVIRFIRTFAGHD